MTINRNILKRAKRVRLLALDCDGVLTDGGVYIFEDGREFRRFNIKDGLGLKQVMQAGIVVAIISSATTQAVRHRADTLGITEVHLGCEDKLAVLREMCKRFEITLEQVAYIGDDLTDLPILQQVGLPCAPANAVTAVKQAVLYVTERSGGDGAVREIADLVVSVSTSAYVEGG